MRPLQQSVRAVLWILSGCILLLWARSNLVSDGYRWVRVRDSGTSFVQTKTEIYCGSGGLGFSSDSFGTNDPARMPRLRWRASQRANLFKAGYERSDEPHYPARVGITDSWNANFGVYWLADQRILRGYEFRQFALTIPLWLLLLLTAGYPVTRYVLCVLGQQRAERIALGMCPHCECDVRGKQTCPRCGKCVVAASVAGA